jgi:hypothetical protein
LGKLIRGGLGKPLGRGEGEPKYKHAQTFRLASEKNRENRDANINPNRVLSGTLPLTERFSPKHTSALQLIPAATLFPLFFSARIFISPTPS